MDAEESVRHSMMRPSHVSRGQARVLEAATGSLFEFIFRAEASFVDGHHLPMFRGKTPAFLDDGLNAVARMDELRL